MLVNNENQVVFKNIRNYTLSNENITLEDKTMKQAKTFTPQELRRVLDYVATRKHAARNRAMLLMTHFAGLRVAETASLRYADVMDENGKIRNEILLRPEQTKGDQARTVFVAEKLRKELEIYIAKMHCTDPQHKLFYTQKKLTEGFSANTLTQYFHYLYKRAGFIGGSSHSGRRSFITSLAAKGVGVRVLMSLAGHASISTTQKYIDINSDMQRKAVELI